MNDLPAICNNCGVVFPSGFQFSGNGTMVTYNSMSGPCPNCGGMGSIPDGIYKTIEGITEELTSLRHSKEEYQKLLKIMENLKEDQDINIKEKINEEAPEFTGILKYLPQNRTEVRSDMRFVIMLIIALIGLIQTSTNSETGNNIKAEQVINHFYESQEINNYYSERVEEVKKEPIRVNKIGRNEKCPCGSGIKYKKCHGK